MPTLRAVEWDSESAFARERPHDSASTGLAVVLAASRGVCASPGQPSRYAIINSAICATSPRSPARRLPAENQSTCPAGQNNRNRRDQWESIQQTIPGRVPGRVQRRRDPNLRPGLPDQNIYVYPVLSLSIRLQAVHIAGRRVIRSHYVSSSFRRAALFITWKRDIFELRREYLADRDHAEAHWRGFSREGHAKPPRRKAGAVRLRAGFT